MIFPLIAIAALVGLAVLGVRMSREVATPPRPMPEPAERTLADWRRDHEAGLDEADGTEWRDCRCCGAPAYEPFAGCDLCGWVEGEGELERARASFALHGAVDSPEEMALWGGIPPGEDERAIVREVLELCAAAPAGRQPGPGFWSELQSRMHALEAAADRRLRAAQQAGLSRDADA